MSDDDAITIYSDYVCPFCYLGRQSLAEYQETREDELAIDWQPFDLRAQKRNDDGSIDHDVDDGKDEEYYEEAKQNVERLKEEYGADEMTVDISRDVDSLPAQVASFYVNEEYPESWLDFDVAIFEALWEDGRDIGDRDVLADLAEDAGLDGDEIREVAGDEEWRNRLREQFSEARERGVSGVPTFAYDGYGARGAVPPEQLERLVEGT
ncbi:DsbA family oxidoreductase [Halobacterium litoreum]|uniref:DsbA family protein n=1 Tax=Halobacterium litoreum TaxID=2039234 RepID=A0ABD5NG11_9EURY|nr:DsbA family protein [Halobacterium litoreum]UHH12867.1 DsbA family protein [Halobacterium litoreum]